MDFSLKLLSRIRLKLQFYVRSRGSDSHFLKNRNFNEHKTRNFKLDTELKHNFEFIVRLILMTDTYYKLLKRD